MVIIYLGYDFLLTSVECLVGLLFQDGLKLEVHSLVVAANSKYLKPWMETTFVPDLNVRGHICAGLTKLRVEI
jgi:hypothetical protein